MFLGTREKFDYVVCATCGCLQIAEIPKDLGRFYGGRYYTRTAKAIERRFEEMRSATRARWTSMRLAAGPVLRPFAGHRYARFAWFTRTQTGIEDAILEVGCGSGRLLGRLHREGFRNLTGIDPHLGPSARSGVSPRFYAESVETHEGTYALVMAHHSFEHVVDPRVAFQAFSRLVEPGGWLLLRIPVADSWACRHYASDWVQLDAPRHLHLHTRSSIARLARDFGFRIDRVVDDSGPFQIWGSELYRRDVPLSTARARGRWLRDGVMRLRARMQAWSLRLTDRGDQACFYLQRIRPD